MPERIFGALSKEGEKNGRIAAIFHKTGKDKLEFSGGTKIGFVGEGLAPPARQMPVLTGGASPSPTSMNGGEA